MNNYHNNNIMHVKNVTLRVGNIEKMLDFYLDVLGMKILDQAANRYSLGTESGRVLVKFIVDEEAENATRTTGLFHYALLFPSRHDLGVFLNYLLAIDYPLAGASDHDVSEAIYLLDPESNGIEIYADFPENKWKRSKDGIYMTTAAIDHASLLKEEGEYENIPQETLMGHLHLRVNNIDQAQAFFIGALGFQKTSDYGPSASFTSDGGYHHHLAFNTWGGSANPHLGPHQLGLIEYAISVPASRVEKLITRLNEAGIEYRKEGNNLYLKDINNTSINMVII
ncbi:MAG TPA: VOC family protein [Bacilli bacterium]|nr:VOC family protein [Bacilli bacterium]